MEGRYLQRSMRAWPIRWRILAIAALAIIAVRTFVTNKGNELNGK